MKKIRRLGVTDDATADHYWHQQYLPADNARFAQAPANDTDFHLPLTGNLRLDDVFCLQHRRTVSNGGIVRFHQQRLQMKTGELPARAMVEVQEHQDGTLHLCYKGSSA